MRQLIEAEKGKLDDDAPDAPDALTYDVDYVIDTWLERKLYGLYPEGGGYNSQDPFLMTDWRKMTMWYLRAKAGTFTAVQVPTDAPSYLDLTRG